MLEMKIYHRNARPIKTKIEKILKSMIENELITQFHEFNH